MAKKTFADIDGYIAEKQVMQEIEEKLGSEKCQDMICMIKNYDAKKKLIQFESGLCNLNEYVREMVKRKVYWWNQLDNLYYIIDRMVNFVIYMGQKKVYHCDIKPVNLVV